MAEASVEVTSILDHVEMFRGLPPQLKAQLEGRLTERTVGPGEVVFNEGDLADAMYVVSSGQVAVSLVDKTLGLSVELARIGGAFA